MIKLPITYTNFNDETVTKSFYFHLSKPELTELQFGKEGGMDEAIKRIVETEDVKNLLGEFQRFILASIGEKSDDGDRFIKNEEIRAKFHQSAAYEKLWTTLSTDADYAAAFFKGLLPKDMQVDQDKPTSPPVLNSPVPPPPPAA